MGKIQLGEYMRQSLVVGNWKMNGSLGSIQTLVNGIKAGLDANAKSQVVVCPPFVYLDAVAKLIKGSKIAMGAQNVSHEKSGAFTGEVACSMLSDFGTRYVILGHSERRALYGETDAMVAHKFTTVLLAGMIPILCVGETLEEREAGDTEAVVARQLDAVVSHVSIKGFEAAVVAYEPVWAIGTGKTATPEQAQEVHAFIRRRLATHSTAIADGLRILYGGSVNAGNATQLLSMADVDGGLVGGASLKAEDFLAICRAAG